MAKGNIPPRRVRIESVGKHIGGRVLIDGTDISNEVLSVDIHMDGKNATTAVVTFSRPDIAVDAALIAAATLGEHQDEPADAAAVDNPTDQPTA